MTQERLDALCATQDGVLDVAAHHVAPGGLLAYATCSLLACENEDRVAAFLARAPEWRQEQARRFTLHDGGDGFFIATLRRT